MACLRHPSPRHQPQAFSRWLQDTVKAEAIDCVIPVYEETFHPAITDRWIAITLFEHCNLESVAQQI